MVPSVRTAKVIRFCLRTDLIQPLTVTLATSSDNGRVNSCWTVGGSVEYRLGKICCCEPGEQIHDGERFSWQDGIDKEWPVNERNFLALDAKRRIGWWKSEARQTVGLGPRPNSSSAHHRRPTYRAAAALGRAHTRWSHGYYFGRGPYCEAEAPERPPTRSRQHHIATRALSHAFNTCLCVNEPSSSWSLNLRSSGFIPEGNVPLLDSILTAKVYLETSTSWAYLCPCGACRIYLLSETGPHCLVID